MLPEHHVKGFMSAILPFWDNTFNNKSLCRGEYGAQKAGTRRKQASTKNRHAQKARACPYLILRNYFLEMTFFAAATMSSGSR